ncbi:hypothetical protein F0U60_16435 [Archangium minus]|uniref:DUF2029 domain-containing protein n=1 Tax=Archangium minus TaxID=83450 RepID=A0ABY9WQI5_9BACT|nr:hypothetical protein F0U60_16435 [Archangium minus]
MTPPPPLSSPPPPPSEPLHPEGWLAPLALAGHALLGFVLARTRGHNNGGFIFVVAGILLLWFVALVRVSRPVQAEVVRNRTRAWAWGVAAFFTVYNLVLAPGTNMDPKADPRPFALLGGLAVLLVGTCAMPLRAPSRFGRLLGSARTVGFFVLPLALGLQLIAASPSPHIDVWELHQQGARALLSGQPVYGGSLQAIDSYSFARTIDSYAYPPLNLLLTTAAYALTGETRHAQLACILVGAFFLWRAARRRVEPGDPLPELLVACLVFHPRGLFTLEQAWGEPLALPFLGAFVYFLGEGRRTAAAVALGLLCATKQHFVLYLPLALLLPGPRWRGAALTVGTAAATFLPFLAWSPEALWKDLVVHHLTNPFRSDSLSLTAWFAQQGMPPLPGWLGFAGALATWALTLARRRGPETVLLGSALVFGVFFFLGRQAFCNYYYQVGATVLAAAVLGLGRGPVEGATAGSPGSQQERGAMAPPPLAA